MLVCFQKLMYCPLFPVLPVKNLEFTVFVFSGVDRGQHPLLAKTRPFVLVDGQRQSLAEALQVSGMKMAFRTGFSGLLGVVVTLMGHSRLDKVHIDLLVV